jgi:hypothetical protein
MDDSNVNKFAVCKSYAIRMQTDAIHAKYAIKIPPF